MEDHYRGRQMVDVRTALNWLNEHHLEDGAEVWVLSDDLVVPVTEVGIGENVYIYTRPIDLTNPTQGLTYHDFLDSILKDYSAGGRVIWAKRPDLTFRGSYVRNPAAAVFLVFLPEQVQLVESHEDKMEQRKEQARTLSERIEKPWD